MAVKDNIEKAVLKDIEDLGFELEYVEVVKEGKENFVRIVIDKENTSLTTEDCEKVSRKIEEKVENIVKLEGGYILEISSAGLERQLKNISLYKKYIGQNIFVRLYKKYQDKKEFEGKLIDVVNDEDIIIQIENEKISFKFADIATANTVYDFNFEKESN